MFRIFIKLWGDVFKIFISSYTTYAEAMFNAEEDIANYVNSSLDKFDFGKYELLIEETENNKTRVVYNTHFRLERTN